MIYKATKYRVCSLSFLHYTNIDDHCAMPRTDRARCVGCDKVIGDGSSFGCNNSVFRFFLSARSLKRIDRTELACRKCRAKFDNWVRKNKDFVLQFTNGIPDESMPVGFCYLFDLNYDFLYRKLSAKMCQRRPSLSRRWLRYQLDEFLHLIGEFDIFSEIKR